MLPHGGGPSVGVGQLLGLGGRVVEDAQVEAVGHVDGTGQGHLCGRLSGVLLDVGRRLEHDRLEALLQVVHHRLDRLEEGGLGGSRLLLQLLTLGLDPCLDVFVGVIDPLTNLLTKDNEFVKNAQY